MGIRGVVESAANLVPFGHLGWGYTDRSEFLARAGEYLLDGVEAGQRVEYVAAAPRHELRREVATMGSRIRQALLDEQISVCPVDNFYAFAAQGGEVDPLAAVAKRTAATDAALSAGYTGFRAVVDATSVARTPGQRSAFARFEHLIDQRMSVLPVSALCAYDITTLGLEAAAELVCLHPFRNPDVSPFALYALDGPGGGLGLVGDVDSACNHLFDITVGRTLPLHPSPRVEVDLGHVRFIDHRALLSLERSATVHDRQVDLLNATATVATVVDLLQLRSVHINPSHQAQM